MHIFQMKPQAVSISEDGRDYKLTVESTVPLPCSSERCTLPLHLTTSSSQGGVKNCSLKLCHVTCCIKYFLHCVTQNPILITVNANKYYSYTTIVFVYGFKYILI